MSVKINVQITKNDIYCFLKRHSLTHMSGVIGRIAIIVFLVLGIYDIIIFNLGDALLFLMGSFIMAFFPNQAMKKKAKKQVQDSEMFQKPLEYEFSEKGVTIRQGDLEVTNEWDAIVKVIKTRKHIIMYMSRVRAMIFPKRCMKEEYEDVIKMIRDNLPPEKVKFK